MSLADLPNETLYNIMYRLPINNVLELCQSNKTFSIYCSDQYFWAKRAQNDFDYPIADFLQNDDLSGLRKYEIIHSEVKRDRFIEITPIEHPFRVKVRLHYYNPDRWTLRDFMRYHYGFYYPSIDLYDLGGSLERNAKHFNNVNKIIKLILDDDRINKWSGALTLAAEHYDIEILQLLLSNPKVPKDQNTIEYITTEIKYPDFKSIDIIDLLLPYINRKRLPQIIDRLQENGSYRVADYLTNYM